MTRETMEIIGIIAGCCTTASFVPQVLHTWRTKSVEDISLRMYLLLCTGVTLWLVYGLLVDSLSVVLANSVTLVLAASVLVMKLRFRNPKE
ncbi:SemiSWEET transporter [Pseudodesulfovibrio sp. zrk46]|uniref:SemiSWEET family sugar transporter n=1 Tax=Pseudodesulfovibrio sp. zrk46 TaxID=2725288 RepID=UPI001FFCC35C|nr:SemiSWEET transporter [Pseudodesulfovibrio sp. zrk46]